MPAKVFILASTLPKVHGGLTSSLLFRAGVLESVTGKPVPILTTDYNPHYEAVYASFAEAGKCSGGQTFFNLYDDLKRAGTESSAPGDWRWLIPAAFRPAHREPVAAQGFIQSQASQFKPDSFDGTHADHWHTDGRCFRVWFMPGGRPVKTELFSPRGLMIEESFLDGLSHMYLRVFYRDALFGKVKDVQYQPQPDMEPVSFADRAKLQQFWLNRRLPKSAFLIMDSRPLDGMVFGLDRRDLKLIVQLHVSQLSQHQVLFSRTRPEYTALVKHAAKAHAIICLTEAQRENLALRLPPSGGTVLRVVRHPVETVERHLLQQPRSGLTVVSRLDPLKRIDHALLAFSLALRKRLGGRKKSGAAMAQWHLDVCGDGVCRQPLEKLALDLGIGDRVRFHGHVKDVGRFFLRSRASLCTSEEEGLSLSMLESIAHGCPVLSYDIFFGPAEAIQPGVNGYLMPSGDIHALSGHMTTLLSDDYPFTGEQVAATMAGFSRQGFVEQWTGLLSA